MQNFDYCTPTRLIFGKGVVEQLPAVMAQFGKKVLLTYGGGSIKKIGLYQKVLEL
ncbi:MAG: iron-containing alcohol dehydrogenase, partial [Bacteroidales bacterium]|nr:iron-containing alcohol dehydrogenase [Bacteroidales bacterium]